MYVDPSRWFDALGSCASCGKPAHGQVRGDRNQSMGNYCTKCGEARVNKAQQAQMRAAKANAKQHSAGAQHE